MRRRLFTFAAAVSLVLCVATVVLWASPRPHQVNWTSQTPSSDYWAGYDGTTLYLWRADRVSEADIQAELVAVKSMPETTWRGDNWRHHLGPDLSWLQRKNVTPGCDGTPGTETDGVVFYIARGTISLHDRSERFGFISFGPLPGSWWCLYVSMWVPFLTFALLPAIAARPLFRYARSLIRQWLFRAEGMCIKCGYNLTGNISGICPECGTACTTSETPAG